jgi:glycine/D-amino acid oxidase-like deaminating enzyme
MLVVDGRTGRSQLHQDLNLPVYKHRATAIETLLDEAIGGGEVLQQVLVFDVVDLDYMVPVGAEEVVVGGHAQHGQHVRDISLAESVTPAQREDAVGSSASQTREPRSGGR